ncbi:histidine phosphatase family protein [Sinirhodobacter populi]|nr:histidine phosphatase family protein [Sinirhodobacter populi]
MGAVVTLPRRAFCLIRHGETDANRDGIIAGRTEARLTARGRAAAAGLAILDWPGRIAVFSSPQERARETAALAFPGLRATVLAGLRERDWGRFEGRPLAERPDREAPAEGWEDWSAMVDRVEWAIAQAVARSGAALPVIVAHSGVIRAARVLTGGGAGGPSAENALPLLFAPVGGGWRERRLFTDGPARGRMG